MMKDSPLVPEKWAEHPYIYNAGRTPAHQRAAMMVDLLDGARDVTLQDAIGFAFSTQVYKAETWQQRIRAADPDGAFCKDTGRLEPPQRRGFAAGAGILPLQDGA